jgi:hypothetical protein
VGSGEAGQHVHRVVTDAKDCDVVPLEVGQVPLQFDQPRLAERLPPGTAVEDDQRLASRTSLVEIDGLPMLVRQDQVGKSVPDPRPYAIEVRHGPLPK